MGCEESNYSEDPNIVLKDDSQIFKYHIIKEGVYPPKHKLKYTRRPAKHPIPHNYIVQTMYLKKIMLLSARYVTLDLEKSVESDQSPSHAAHLYCQRKCILGLEEQLREFIEEEKENFFYPNDSIVLKQAKFEINNCTYNINYRKIDKQLVELQTQAIVKSIDHGQISQEAYRSLAKLDESLIRAGAIYDMRQEITHKVNEKIPISLVDINQPTIFEPITEEADITDPTIVSNIVTSIGKRGHRRITDILNYIIPLYVQKEV
ncbi:hypothetical protein C2G38_2262460 [Gigaspora rosea]|uniref:Uncharacterized protein n=1 Tax=Gigaspora rosea TaxID=44941 RepID=A0A397UPK5_9GLOM|nr:hypothetical protein C2G38_2262460 [Gigaspora rosea]